MGMAKALFLDRDGVINTDKPYVHRCEDFEFQDGIFDLCRAAQTLHYILIVVTNQAGIGRGYYSEEEFLGLTAWMNRQFAEQGVRIARVYHCPYHPVHGVGDFKRESEDRKPNPGMILRAHRDFNLSLQGSVLIGNNLSDIEAGKAAGVGTNILLGASSQNSLLRGQDFVRLDSLDGIRMRFFNPSE